MIKKINKKIMRNLVGGFTPPPSFKEKKNFLLRFFHVPNYKNRINLVGGFTLVELMVVISIFAILSSITIYNYNQFNSTLSIQNLADDIALTVRKAQGFAIGVRGYGGSFSRGYGIHFSANQNTEEYKGSNKSFVLFADTIENSKYDYNSGDNCGELTAGNECIEILSIKSADGINVIYYNEKDEDHKIESNGTVDIIFNRPNPEPKFCVRNDPNDVSCMSISISRIIIEVSNIGNSNVFKTITISSNGQISVS